jgi:hypothetical protein
MKNAHLRRSPHPSSLRRTFKYASLLRISGALHLGIFDQPEEKRALAGSAEENPPLPPFSKGGMGGFGIWNLDIGYYLVIGA